MRRLVFLLAPVVAAVASFVACNGEDLDLGDNASAQDGGAPGSSTTDATAGTSDDGGVVTVGTQDGESAGDDDETWSGYVENYAFPSGSDDLVVTFTRNADGSVTGHAVFGDLPFYPPPTDPNVGYPITDLDGGNQEPSGVLGALEGFRYKLLNGSIDGTRLRAAVDPNELYAGWCALQPSSAAGLPPGAFCGPVDYDGGPGGEPPYAVPPTCYLTSELGAHIPVNCARYGLCASGICTCTSGGCTDTVDYGYEPTFDFQLAGSQASGSLIVPPSKIPHNIYLTRQ